MNATLTVGARPTGLLLTSLPSELDRWGVQSAEHSPITVWEDWAGSLPRRPQPGIIQIA
jgi:hypothetical protein